MQQAGGDAIGAIACHRNNTYFSEERTLMNAPEATPLSSLSAATRHLETLAYPVLNTAAYLRLPCLLRDSLVAYDHALPADQPAAAAAYQAAGEALLAGYQVLKQCRADGLRLRLDGAGQVRLGPKSLVTRAHQEQVTTHHAALVAWLGAEQPAASMEGAP